VNPRPTLVIVSGAPASGKTTLAGHLSRELGFPLISRDDLKEVMMDALGAPDRARSREIGGASYAVLFRVLKRLLAAGVSTVTDSNFTRGLAEIELAPIVAQARTVQVQCTLPAELIERRYIARLAASHRHQGHHDEAALPDVLAALAAGRYEPLALDTPLMVVDTSSGYSPSIERILAAIRAERPD
jgi:predicted kinase